MPGTRCSVKMEVGALEFCLASDRNPLRVNHMRDLSLSTGDPGAVALPPNSRRNSMRTLITASLALLISAGLTRAEDPTKQAPKVVLKSPDGKKTYDLEK